MNDENPFGFMPTEAGPQPPRPIDLITEYIQLRDRKKAAEEAYKQWVEANINRRLDRIEAELMAFLNDSGTDSIKTANGTAFKRTETSVTVADQKEFSRYVISSEAWGLIDFRASKTGVKEFLEEHQSLPPGINFIPATVISVRKPS